MSKWANETSIMIEGTRTTARSSWNEEREWVKWYWSSPGAGFVSWRQPNWKRPRQQWIWAWYSRTGAVLLGRFFLSVDATIISFRFSFRIQIKHISIFSLLQTRTHGHASHFQCSYLGLISVMSSMSYTRVSPNKSIFFFIYDEFEIQIDLPWAVKPKLIRFIYWFREACSTLFMTSSFHCAMCT